MTRGRCPNCETVGESRTESERNPPWISCKSCRLRCRVHFCRSHERRAQPRIVVSCLKVKTEDGVCHRGHVDGRCRVDGNTQRRPTAYLHGGPPFATSDSCERAAAFSSLTCPFVLFFNSTMSLWASAKTLSIRRLMATALSVIFPVDNISSVNSESSSSKQNGVFCACTTTYTRRKSSRGPKKVITWPGHVVRGQHTWGGARSHLVLGYNGRIIFFHCVGGIFQAFPQRIILLHVVQFKQESRVQSLRKGQCTKRDAWSRNRWRGHVARSKKEKNHAPSTCFGDLRRCARRSAA